MSAHQVQPSITPEDLRAALARVRIPRYLIAARVRLHPASLGLRLNGKRPLRPELAERIMRAIHEEALEAQARR